MDKDFEKELRGKLNYARETFEHPNKAFILNVNGSIPGMSLQIIHPGYYEKFRQRDDSFGFALHITFPPSAQVIQFHDNFIQLDVSKEFVKYYYEDIPCYIIDLGTDVEKTVQLTTNILRDVYEYKGQSKLEIELTDEGKVSDWG